MSSELRDFRCRISERVYYALECRAIAEGRDKQDIARQWLEEKSEIEIHAMRLGQNFGLTKGDGREPEGIPEGAG